MKCGAWVKYEPRRKRGSGAPYMKPVAYGFPDSGLPDHRLDMLTAQGFTQCNGRIVAQVESQLEPYCCPCSPVLEISYTCETCGNTHYPHLPADSGSISALLTDAIVSL